MYLAKEDYVLGTSLVSQFIGKKFQFHEKNIFQFFYIFTKKLFFFSLLGDQHPLSLVHPDNQMLGKFVNFTKKNNNSSLYF